jgi:hypothetical protein
MLDRALHALARDLARQIAHRDVRGGERDPQARTEEHHRHGVIREAGGAREVLGVAHEVVVAAEVRGGFAHRRGADAAHAAGFGGVDRRVERDHLRVSAGARRHVTERLRVPARPDLDEADLACAQLGFRAALDALHTRRQPELRSPAGEPTGVTVDRDAIVSG